MPESSILAVRNLAKRYGGVTALQDMNLRVERGAIHAVVGENGAGKSTLMKALAGVVRPDSGAIEMDGEEVAIDSPGAARNLGIGIVYQELSLFPQRSVLANLFVNREPGRFGFVSGQAMEERSRDLLDRLGPRVDVREPVGLLSIGEQQLVELCRVLLEEPRLLILDEPNSALNKGETERLFEVLRQLRARGITMLYVSHRLEEVFAISDAVTITRNGRDVLTKDRSVLTIPEVIEGMIGQRREALFPPRIEQRADSAPAEIVVKGLSGGKLRDISFTARSGEIVGLAGLEGSGVSNLLELLFGALKAPSGEVVYPDGCGLPRNPTEAARRGVCLVPADRRRHGLMLEKSVLFNLGAVMVGARQNGPFYSVRGARERAMRQISRLFIKARSPDSLARELSGGNQQKVVIGKWLETAPRVFLLDDPTRGVDVGAKREVYDLIRQMSADGGIVLFCSTELPELVGLCDRILVIYQGRMVGELSGREIESGTVLHLINTGEAPRSANSAHD
jgi:ABC-type sugar transport system ATPase subunit